MVYPPSPVWRYEAVFGEVLDVLKEVHSCGRLQVHANVHQDFSATQNRRSIGTGGGALANLFVKGLHVPWETLL